MVIKANELRIGNWLMDVDGSFIKVESIYAPEYDDPLINIDPDISFGDYLSPTLSGNLLKKLRPIPLTPEILEKAGFKEYFDFGYRTGLYDRLKPHRFTYEIYKKQVMVLHPGNNISHWLAAKIEYLHQLQNLYFALTGEELNVEL